ncbi:MAG: exo-alpha-sialidase [Acidobacteria bacterium]|nr:exo-alpha-sialidase [Acidobacteriota bacterium]
MSASAATAAATGVTREVFIASPKPGTAVLACAWYTERRGGKMASPEQRRSRPDTVDMAYYRHSTDFGKTWSAPESRPTGEKRPEGMLRRHPRAGWVDPQTGRHIEFWVEGVLPSDDPLEGLRQWNVFYSVAGGAARQAIHRGAEFKARHPWPGIWTGKNSVMIGDMPCRPLAVRGGRILVPVSFTRIDANGSVYNPTGAYTYHDSAVLIGRWRNARELEWEMSAAIQADPARATRGMAEPTLAPLADGRILCVLRGSNDKRPDLPSYRWHSFSADGGRTWTQPAPWRYAEGGEPFFSPSACSQLLDHPNGKLYWLGNITPVNARGNRPRYPFVMGEVDRRSGLLQRASLRTIDGRGPDDDPL